MGLKRESGWEMIKRLLGLAGHKCENEGIKIAKGECRCQRYFAGPQCQWIQCVNGGVNVSATECNCNGVRYYGRHCHMTTCDNGGRDNGRGACDCVTGWYYGKYCETYGSPWIIVFSVAAALLISFLCICVLCRIGLRFPCRSDGEGANRRNRRRRTVRSREIVEMVVPRGAGTLPPPPYEMTKPPSPTLGRSETPPPTYEIALSMSRENLNVIGSRDNLHVPVHVTNNNARLTSLSSGDEIE